MSPVSRGRKGKNKKKVAQSTRPTVTLGMFSALDLCDCPACSGEALDPAELVEMLVEMLAAVAADLLGSQDPLEAEILGAVAVSIGAIAGAQFDEVLIEVVIPEFEARGCPETVAMLLAISAVAGDRVGHAASAAADRLVEAGIPRPGWAGELGAPVTAEDCRRLSDPEGTGSMLTGMFHRAGRSHAVVVSVDDLDCGAATDILVLAADQLPAALEMMRAHARARDVEVTEEPLDPSELCWHIDNALQARAVHDSDHGRLDLDELLDADDGQPGYPAMAVLLRARMRTLPAPNKPPAHHGDADEGRAASLAALETLAQLARGGIASGRGPVLPRGPMTAAIRPVKRATSAPPPIYQIKVGLRGATPPIWRRLEVPADISLARLHRIIQVAFGWEDGHLHVFSTPYGEFGIPDAELGHRAESPVTFEQVAPTARSTIRYTYDFGDDWEHDVMVEKVLARDTTVSYPRCTGGRRAAPPEDCGGIWGYTDLLAVLADPTHPDHDDRLEWLGLTAAGDFDPAQFNPHTVTQALSHLR
ncbi:MAG: plasmid pRiA4b ORF-3 family protein [Pseudonocardia sp.]|uniref:plasmid pRiA4b ORF-3 family protein n=1 Tax=Pseudonocardia sp. TaxID=60912 RepID=UPI001AD4996B|nr:plasmid pRiA4b ORF-3 family protein [Pseudonocardia sp.]MBN9096797.1 plasmid pRiA4b ORF-3 family protein [Pseudonocardia sp.]